MSRKELALISRDLNGRGQLLVLTNGCFDLLHVGHIRYLRDARAMGDALAVGLNSDASVRRLKGLGRPVTPAIERAELLASLRSVDYVTIFDEDTATELVTQVRPAIYVKGGDYSVDPSSDRFPVEGHVVERYGGAVRVLPFTRGASTTELLRRIRSNVASPGTER